MRMTFLGTAGGRFAIINQMRASGGILLELDGEAIHIDPGPGALVRAKEYGVRLDSLTAVAISHCHPDHYADAEFAIEAMTHGTTRSGGTFIGNVHAMNGGDGFRAAVSPYHMKAVGRKLVMKPGDEAELGKVRVSATRTSHSEPEGIGFVFRGSKSIGYTSDTAYFGGMEDAFAGLDYLVLNVLRPRGKDWPRHMNTGQAAKLISLAKPKTAILTHFGMLMLKAGPWKEAKHVEDETGVKTIAARDGQVISDGDGGPAGSAGGAGKSPGTLKEWIS